MKIPMNETYIPPLADDKNLRVLEPTRAELPLPKRYIEIIEERNGWRARFVGALVVAFMLLGLVIWQSLTISRLLILVE